MIPIAIIANALTPYRNHVHERIAREIPQIKLWSVFTHEVSNADWAFKPSPQINAVMFGKGEATAQQAAPNRALHEWHKAGDIIDFLREQKMRFVLVNGYNDAGRVRIIRWCNKNHVPVMLWSDSNIRGDTARGIRALVKRALVKRIVKWCDGIMPCGTLGAQYFTRYGASAERMFYMPYEPDYQMIRAIDESFIEQVRQRFNLSGQRRVVYSGRLAAVKRVDLLLEAFSRIAADRPEWELLIIGDGPLRAELEKRNPPRTRWTGFLDDQKTIAGLYRASDVLVLPSDFEPWAVVINEAAAAGLAIVASDVVGAAAELVRDGVNGRIFPAGNLEKLTESLREVTDPHKIDVLKSGSETVLQEWQKRGDPVEGLRKALAASKVLP